MEIIALKLITSLIIWLKCMSVVYPCVLLLNGWTPVSVRERTKSADLVVSGTVLKTFKDVRTMAKTYSAEVEISNMYKGGSLLPQIRSKYNISNFGDKPACYADVFEGEMYIFFLTLFEGRLSAKYDDIFGAIADFSTENEEEVLQAQGWEKWSVWSSCSKGCGGGERTRERQCLHKDGQCEGETSEIQPCNSYNCAGIVDVLELLHLSAHPRGVQSIAGRTNAYRVTSNARLNYQTSNVFGASFPRDFSILLAVNLKDDFSGYIFTITDRHGVVSVGIHYDGGVWRFEYRDQEGLPGHSSPIFDGIPLLEETWNHIAFQIEGQAVRMFLNCEEISEQGLLRTRYPRISTNSVMAIGPFNYRSGSALEVEIEQLVLSDSPGTAGRQCGVEMETLNTTRNGVNGREMVKTESNSRGEGSPRFTWSQWSPCSVSCGQGLQTRSLYCTGNHVSGDDCIPKHIPRYQAKRCHLQQCPGKCAFPCLNGGVCDQNGYCSCKAGYTGRQCQQALCDPVCRNGGYCVSPGQCSCPYGFLQPDCAPFCRLGCLNGGTCVGADVCLCPPGFSGSRCEKAICEEGCMNGGQCIGANKCSCRHGFTGSHCQEPVCNPPCKNAGVCVKPYQCSCRAGTIGWYCEHFVCSKRCKNGGVCVGPNKCSCPAGFRGSRCQKRACGGGCLNGGRCVRKKKCQCPLGFKGKRCQKRTCHLEEYLEPLVKTYLHTVRNHVYTRCGTWTLQTCIRTRIRYVTMARQVFRPVLKCV